MKLIWAKISNNKVYCTEKMWSFFESRKFNIYYIPGLAWDPLLILQVGLKRLCRNCSGCLSRHLTQILYVLWLNGYLLLPNTSCGLGAFGPYPPGPPPLSPRNRRAKVAPHSHTEQQKGKHPTEPHENPTETHRVLRKSHRIPPSPSKSHRNPPKIPPAKKGKLVSLYKSDRQ